MPVTQAFGPDAIHRNQVFVTAIKIKVENASPSNQQRKQKQIRAHQTPLLLRLPDALELV